MVRRLVESREHWSEVSSPVGSDPSSHILQIQFETYLDHYIVISLLNAEFYGAAYAFENYHKIFETILYKKTKLKYTYV